MFPSIVASYPSFNDPRELFPRNVCARPICEICAPRIYSTIRYATSPFSLFIGESLFDSVWLAATDIFSLFQLASPGDLIEVGAVALDQLGHETSAFLDIAVKVNACLSHVRTCREKEVQRGGSPGGQG